MQSRSGKLAGLAQRVVSGGAWCEALIVIRAAPDLRALARHVHEVLDLEWSESAQGELAELLPGAPDLHAALADALTTSLTQRLGPLEHGALPRDVSADALALAAGHRL